MHTGVSEVGGRSDRYKCTQLGSIFATTMEGMFANDPFLYINSNEFSNWDVANVQNMDSMFAGCSNYVGTNSGIEVWNTSQVTSMNSMFGNAVNFAGNLASWDVSRVTSMIGMFNNATTYNEDITGWDVSSVSMMSFMFEDAISFEHNIGRYWDFTSLYNFDNNIYSEFEPTYFMFSGATLFNMMFTCESSVANLNFDNGDGTLREMELPGTPVV